MLGRVELSDCFHMHQNSNVLTTGTSALRCSAGELECPCKMDSFRQFFLNDDMKMRCPVCRLDRASFCCGECTHLAIIGPQMQLETLQCDIGQTVRKLSLGSPPQTGGFGTSVIQVLLEELNIIRMKVSSLNEEYRSRSEMLSSRRERLLDAREKFEARRKRIMPKQEVAVSFETYMKEASRYDKSLSSLHPFRKLRSIAHTLFEERRSLCMKLLSMFRFRLISMHEDTSLGTPTVPGVSELVGDFYTLDGQKDQLSVVLLFMVPLIIILCKIIDTPLPFPLVYGTLCTSPVLHSPRSVYSFGCPPYPRILYAHKKLVIPLEGTITNEALGLLTEDLRFLSSEANQSPLNSVPFMEPMALLSTIFTSSNLGRAIYKGPMSGSFPSSPSISASSSPILSSSYRKSVIEQSLTEGGEWTLLDQL